MAEVASAFVSLMPSAKGFGKSTERQIGPQMNSVAKRTGSRFGKVFATATMSPLRAIGAAAIGLFAIKKVKDFFTSAISEARESQKVSAITAQVIKSTGGAAQISAAQVGRLATSISNMTGIDDEAIQSGANLLLTFKNIKNEAGDGNDIFDQTTRIMTDMSVAMGTDAKSSAIQLGKALNDPIKGISALSRVGVTFTDDQKKQIETMVKSGNVLGAQKVILRELKSEFGGTAAAAATASDKFKTAFANLQEAVGTALLPYLDQLLLKGVEVIRFLQNDVPRGFGAFKDAVGPVASVIQSFVEDHLPAFKTALAGLSGSAVTSVITLLGGGLVSALGILLGALASPVALIGALVGAFVYAYRTSEVFRDRVDQVVAWMRENFIPVMSTIGDVIRDDVIPALSTFADWLMNEAYPALIGFWRSVSDKLIPSLVALRDTFRDDVLPAARDLLGELRQHEPALRRVAELVFKFEAAWTDFSSSLLGKVLPKLIKVTGFLIGSHLSAVAAVIDIVFDWIGALGKIGGALGDAAQAIGRFVGAVKDKFGEAVSFAKTVPGKLLAPFSGIASQFYSAGGKLVSMLASGIRDKAEDAVGALKDLAGKLAGLVPGSPVKDGPLKSFNGGGAGKKLMQMLADGIVAGAPGALSAAVGAATSIEKGVLDRLTSMRDGARGILDGLKSDFASLKSSVASTFTGDLFSATNVGDFLPALSSARMDLGALTRAFHKLENWGLKPEFLAQLFQSGNGALILDLASGSKSNAVNAGVEFGAIQSLSNQLGGQVARDSIGPKIDRTNDRLERIEKAIDRLPRGFGRELDHAGNRAGRGR